MCAIFMTFTMQTGFAILEAGCASLKNEVNGKSRSSKSIHLTGEHHDEERDRRAGRRHLLLGHRPRALYRQGAASPSDARVTSGNPRGPGATHSLGWETSLYLPRASTPALSTAPSYSWYCQSSSLPAPPHRPSCPTPPQHPPTPSPQK